MVRSPGVQEPQREFWFSTQRTDSGVASPPRYWSLSSLARCSSASSVGLRRRSDRSSRSTMVLIHSASSLRVIEAGIITMIRSPSR